MSQKSSAVRQARKELIQQTLEKICETRDFWGLKRRTFVVLAHLWLHITAEKEGLFELDEWAHTQLRERLIGKLETFLIKHIR